MPYSKEDLMGWLRVAGDEGSPRPVYYANRECSQTNCQRAGILEMGQTRYCGLHFHKRYQGNVSIAPPSYRDWDEYHASVIQPLMDEMAARRVAREAS